MLKITLWSVDLPPWLDFEVICCLLNTGFHRHTIFLAPRQWLHSDFLLLKSYVELLPVNDLSFYMRLLWNIYRKSTFFTLLYKGTLLETLSKYWVDEGDHLLALKCAIYTEIICRMIWLENLKVCIVWKQCKWTLISEAPSCTQWLKELEQCTFKASSCTQWPKLAKREKLCRHYSSCQAGMAV